MQAWIILRGDWAVCWIPAELAGGGRHRLQQGRLLPQQALTRSLEVGTLTKASHVHEFACLYILEILKLFVFSALDLRLFLTVRILSCYQETENFRIFFFNG